jgi:2-oxoisovalerate dehydrogenase E2 component (dihydrolipoyl transacylase)
MAQTLGGGANVAKVTMPQLGESVAEGTIGKWLKQPGDTVAKYEPLLEVITDKVNAEVPSPFAGVLREILAEEGATVPNNAEIAVIETSDEAGADAPPPVALEKDASASERESEGADVEIRSQQLGEGSPGSAPAATPAPAAASPAPAEGPAGSDERSPAEVSAAAQTTPAASNGRSDAIPAAATSAPTATGDPDARMTPAVRRLLREHGLSPAQIVGTGHGGRITREDVSAVVEAQRTGAPVPGAGQPASAPAAAAAQAAPAARSGSPAAAPGAPAPVFADGATEQLVPWTQMRKGVAAAMVRSTTTVPHAYTTVEADVTALVALRESEKRSYQEREGIGLSFVPFVVKATVEALRNHPLMNALWTDEGLLVKRRINVGIAIALDNGLIVPVIQDADQLSISGLNRAVQDLAARARANRLQLADLQGGTITVNNTGWFGSVSSQSIVNTPQISIVNMEAIVKRPVVREMPDGDVIAIRSMMNVGAAFDHRATDGAQIGRFVGDIRAWLESVGPDTAVY